MSKYGHFDDTKKEFVVTSHFPPVPWINFLGNENLTAIISQSAGGCAFYREASTGRLTKYNQARSTPGDRPGFYLYIREADGTLWCPGFEPVRTPIDRWVCRHGLGYTVFESEYRGLSVTLTFFVPRADNVLLWDVRVENKRPERVEISAFSYVEFSFLTASREPIYWQWSRFYTSTTFDPALDAVKYDYHVFEENPKLKVTFSSSQKTAGFDCDRSSFLGRAGTLDAPESLRNGRLANRELPGGGFPIGVLENRIALDPGESTELVLALGCGFTWEESEAIARKYKEPAEAHRELESVKKYWSGFVDVFQTDLPDTDLQRMINLWNPYNCSISFNRKKSMTAFTTGMEKGGVQSRDSSQDSMPLVSLRTDMAGERLLLIYRYQMPSGEFYSSFDPDAGKPADFYAVRSDNGVWPVFTTHAYVAETGDFGFLQTAVPYYQGETATILDHMAQGLKHIASRRGKNNLPLIVDVDWNDNLYIFKVDGKEESVMVGQQLTYACRLLGEMAGHAKREDIVDFCEAMIAEMTHNLNEPGVWDGEWYRRYIFSDERPALGSSERREGRIFLETQVWAVISSTADPQERGRLCMDKAREILGSRFGLRLLFPPFTGIPEPEDPLYNNGPGIRENGGIFHHVHTWAVMAETMLGRGDRAYEYYRQILPNVASQSRGEDIYLNEPYAFSSTTLIDPDLRPGEADMAWFTGTVAWMYWVGTQYLLGIRPVLDGMLIDPCIPSHWDGYQVARTFRGVRYRIRVKNPSHICKGVRSISVDGEKIQGCVLRGIEGKREVQVEVIMGHPAS
jgi:cellobiose phosphorylase